MADLTDSDLAYLSTVLGSDLDEGDLQERYDRLGDTRKVASEVLDIRYADLLAKPDSFTIPGEYSETRSKQIDALNARRMQVGRSVVEASYPDTGPCGR